MPAGVLAFGAYIPRLRLPRRLIAEANGWLNPALLAQAKGERAICNWDEDAITMGVEAARNALTATDRDGIRSVALCSTTLPFTDRLNAGLLAGALNLREAVSAQDMSGSQRAGTSALRSACEGAQSCIVVAAERRPTKAASTFEMVAGDAAAAVVVGEGRTVAKVLAKATSTVDFVDHYRTPEAPFDYQWEERWIRDAGYLTIVPPVIQRCLAEARLKPADVSSFCMPAPVARVADAVAKAAGIPGGVIADTLHSSCGDAGAAQALLMLVATLETAKPGQRILVVGFGQGADAVLLEVTEAIESTPRSSASVAQQLARRREMSSYTKSLSFNDTIAIDRGLRAEVDKQTPLSAMWRNRHAVTGFMGGRCKQCGTVQFPKSRICVGPNCNALDSQELHPFADQTGRIVSYTADRLTYTPDPPACYGMIQFDEGGRWMMDFVDVEPDTLAVGQTMRMVFRIKDIDPQRGFKRYFWKAAPTI